GASPRATLKTWSAPGTAATGAFACAGLIGVPREPLPPTCWPTAKPRTAPTQTAMKTFQLLFTSKPFRSSRLGRAYYHVEARIRQSVVEPPDPLHHSVLRSACWALDRAAVVRFETRPSSAGIPPAR